MDPVVILANDTVAAGPGGEARLQLRVRNQGRRVESYAVEVVGAPARFAQVEPTNVSVLPGKEAEVTITFRPPVGVSTPTGVLPFGVRAVSEVGSSSSAVAEGSLELAGGAGLQAWADATTASGRWSGKYRLSFSNQGNAAARLFIAAHDASAAMRLAVRDEILSVPPGAQVDTEITAKARQPFLRGSAVNRIITASCQEFPFGAERPVPGQAPPRDDPHHRTFQLTFQQKPVVSKLVLALGALVVAGAVAFALLRLRGNKEEVVALGLARPSQPSEFEAVEDGSSTIVLSWRGVPNASGYDVRRTTVDGQQTGPVVEQLDASTFTHAVGELEPGETACFAVVATGPEGVESSEQSEFKCATTTAAPTLAPPTNFTAAADESSPGTFDLQWEAPPDADGVTYTLFVDSKPSDEGIDGVSTRIELEPGDVSREAELKVKAVKGDQISDASNAVTVVVAADLPEVETTVPVTSVGGDDGGGVVVNGGDGDGGGATATTTAGGGTATTAPDGATTTAATTTTVLPTEAQAAIEDHDEMSVAWMGAVQPIGIGTEEAQQRARLARDFAVPADEIRTFTNRDTIANDADVLGAGPDARFFYVRQTNTAAATGLCRGETLRCRPMTLEGAANAAEGGTAVCVIARLPVATTLKVLDETLATKRTDLARPQIHVLDGATRGQFDDDELVIFASGFRDQTEVADFCAVNGVAPGTPVVIEPEP